MKQFVQHAFLKSLVISLGFSLVCIIFGYVSGNPYEISLAGEVIFFLVLFFAELIEHLWKNRTPTRP